MIEERLNQIERHLVELGADEPQAQPLIVEPEPEPSVPATQVLVSPDDQSGSDLQDEPVVAASVEETPRKEPPVVSDAASLVDETFVEETSESVQVAFLHESEKTVIVDQFAKNKPAATTPFELIIGGKWMAWVGAAAVVASVVFFLKLAYDQGWWDSVSPVSRCLMAGAFGVAMIGGGEFCLRKISKAASVGLFGAGLSVLYLVAWAASARYQVVSIEASFLLMAVVAVGGFAVTFRSRFLTIGVLSLVGGYAAPMLLSGLAGSDIMLLGYLTTLLAIALALAAAKPSEFRVLRFIALGMHSIPAFFWLASSGGTHWIIGIVFITVWWSMVMAESMLAALRERSAISNVVATLLSTTAYITAGAWLLNGFRPA
ncbi:DUF2339 domain-containing protein, partial [Phycisphaeraceae bacterium AH-315-B13]|nr:DUF2339 domain-containing protein [Phycisphaeraceae bacterium AH-315-B13]